MIMNIVLQKRSLMKTLNQLRLIKLSLLNYGIIGLSQIKIIILLFHKSLAHFSTISDTKKYPLRWQSIKKEKTKYS